MTVPFAHYRDTMEKLVTSAGGIVEDHLFVTKPGVVILETTEPTKEAINIYRTMNIHLEENENNSYLSSGEFKARITYLAYPREQPLDEEKTNAYHNKMIKELKHYSPYDGTTVTFLIAGVSVESGLEFVAHREATVARLTSSKTHAQDYTLYRIQPHVDVDVQKKLVHSFLETFRNPQIQNESSRKNLGFEVSNMYNLCTKTMAFTYKMSIKDLHKLFIGRISPHGNEQEVQEVCSMMCDLLHERYPLIIDKSEDYYKRNTAPDTEGNGEKLNVA